MCRKCKWNHKDTQSTGEGRRKIDDSDLDNPNKEFKLNFLFVLAYHFYRGLFCPKAIQVTRHLVVYTIYTRKAEPTSFT